MRHCAGWHRRAAAEQRLPRRHPDRVGLRRGGGLGRPAGGRAGARRAGPRIERGGPEPAVLLLLAGLGTLRPRPGSGRTAAAAPARDAQGRPSRGRRRAVAAPRRQRRCRRGVRTRRRSSGRRSTGAARCAACGPPARRCGAPATPRRRCGSSIAAEAAPPAARHAAAARPGAPLAAGRRGAPLGAAHPDRRRPAHRAAARAAAAGRRRAHQRPDRAAARHLAAHRRLAARVGRRQARCDQPHACRRAGREPDRADDAALRRPRRSSTTRPPRGVAAGLGQPRAPGVGHRRRPPRPCWPPCAAPTWSCSPTAPREVIDQLCDDLRRLGELDHRVGADSADASRPVRRATRAARATDGRQIARRGRPRAAPVPPHRRPPAGGRPAGTRRGEHVRGARRRTTQWGHRRRIGTNRLRLLGNVAQLCVNNRR